MIISRFPPGQPVTERAIPTPIFNTDPKVRNYFLRKWSRDSSITDFDIRFFIDWEYYIDRFSTTIRKIITIPAGLQGIDNPVKRVKEPDWLKKAMRKARCLDGQKRISDMFKRSTIPRAVTPSASTTAIGNGDDNGDGGEEEMEMDQAVLPDWENEMEEEPQRSSSSTATPSSTTVQQDMAKENAATSSFSTATTATIRRNVKRNENFEEWLSLRKEQWRPARRRLNPASTTPFSSSSSSSNNNNNTSTSSYYQILEIQKSEGSELLLWLLTPANQLQRVRVKARHTLYIRTNQSLEDKYLKSVSLDLPVSFLTDSLSGVQGMESGNGKGGESGYLYEITVDEEEVEKTIAALEKSSDVNNIQGVFNSKCPALYSAILQMGCVCRLVLPERYSASASGILRHVVNLGTGVLDSENVIHVKQTANPYLA